MRVAASSGRDDLARVYIVEYPGGGRVECAESLQPPRPIEDKWVMLVSTLFGCPVGCPMCDAGTGYSGKLTSTEIMDQILMMVRRRYPDLRVPAEQFKVQFARMGEPALNPDVLGVLRELPGRISAPGFMPSISTVAPRGTEGFFEGLLDVKNTMYPGGMFQLQFSLHTTDPARRSRLVPVDTWSMREMAEYGERFMSPGDRKVTLNFALAKDSPLSPDVLLENFDPSVFLVKITPLNPTCRALENGLSTSVDPDSPESAASVVSALEKAGYDVIVSIGEQEENRIGSNCGQYLKTWQEKGTAPEGGYTYPLMNGCLE